MTTRSAQPFGRRGRNAPAVVGRPMEVAAARPRLAQKDFSVSPELVAALVNPDGETSQRIARGGDKVPRSFRAAILAGLIVAIVSAATNATFSAEANQELGILSAFGAGNAPIFVALLLGALWSGARTSALILLVTHRLLASMQRTSHISYGIAGGVVALAFALLMQALGKSTGPGGLSMEVVTGFGAGMFYRMFAGARRPEN